MKYLILFLIPLFTFAVPEVFHGKVDPSSIFINDEEVDRNIYGSIGPNTLNLNGNKLYFDGYKTIKIGGAKAYMPITQSFDKDFYIAFTIAYGQRVMIIRANGEKIWVLY